MGHRIDRIWLLGGIVAIVLLAAAGWFLLIHPKYSDASTVRGQVGDEQVALVKLNHDVADLNKKKKDLPKIIATQAAYQAALPVDVPGITSFLRQLQNSGTAVQVDVSGVTVGQPSKSSEIATVFEIPITMVTSGDAPNLSQFLSRLQTVQPRAVLINQVGLSGAGTTADPNLMSASLSLTVFVSSSNGSSPIVTTN